MDNNLMDALNVVVTDLVASGMTEEQSEAIAKKLLWILICRL